MKSLTGRVALVTGSSRGIGKGVALCLAQAGADLVLNATADEHLSDVIQQIRALGQTAIGVSGDVADPATSESMVQTALHHWGHVDAAICCAGINRDRMLHKMTDEAWRSVIDVNLNGAFYLTARSAREMRKAGWGRILHISSAAWQGNLGQSNYAASKAGLIALAKTAARELASHGITCNAICPGLIDTDMTRLMPDSSRARILSRIPVARAGQPEDIGKAAVFLCSDSAAYINGQVLGVDGGLVL